MDVGFRGAGLGAAERQSGPPNGPFSAALQDDRPVRRAIGKEPTATIEAHGAGAEASTDPTLKSDDRGSAPACGTTREGPAPGRSVDGCGDGVSRGERSLVQETQRERAGDPRTVTDPPPTAAVEHTSAIR